MGTKHLRWYIAANCTRAPQILHPTHTLICAWHMAIRDDSYNNSDSYTQTLHTGIPTSLNSIGFYIAYKLTKRGIDMLALKTCMIVFLHPMNCILNMSPTCYIYIGGTYSTLYMFMLLWLWSRATVQDTHLIMMYIIMQSFNCYRMMFTSIEDKICNSSIANYQLCVLPISFDQVQHQLDFFKAHTPRALYWKFAHTTARSIHWKANSTHLSLLSSLLWISSSSISRAFKESLAFLELFLSISNYPKRSNYRNRYR